MKSAFITGANSFIAKHLISRLVTSGIEVVKWHHTDPLEVPNVDYIFHFAAYGNHSKQQDPQITIESNEVLTKKLLEATQSIPYTKFINISTSSVYGKCDKPMIEGQKLNPETAYARSKAAAEDLCDYHRATHKKPIITVRPFSVYGPGEAEFRFIPTIIRKLRMDEVAEVEPNAVHDWIFVEDFVDGLMILLEKDLKYNVYNLGSGEQHTNLEIVSMIENQMVPMERETLIKQVTGLRPQDSPVWQADITRMKELGWSPKTPIKEGLWNTISNGGY